MNKYDAIVIGGGAAGLMAAGRIAERNGTVLLLEKMPRPGKKILITGKGRCNITNNTTKEEYLKHIFPKPRFLQNSFNAFFVDETIAFMHNYGVITKEERGKRIFPESDDANDVANALVRYNDNENVTILNNAEVKSILIEKGKVTGVKFEILGEKKRAFADNIILATGGASYPATGSTGDGYRIAKNIGHKITDIFPALIALNTEGNLAQRFMGVSLKNSKISLRVDNKKICDEFGELVFTHFGLSGPIILTISRKAVLALKEEKKVSLEIDLKPALDDVKLDKRLLRDLEENHKKKIETIFKLWLPAKMIPVFLEELKIDPEAQGHQITAKQRKQIRIMMKNLTFNVTSHRPLNEAIITAGGISLKDISSKTLESKKIGGLFFAGEILDVDAETGGYNLQIAFSTGFLAGDSVADKIENSY